MFHVIDKDEEQFKNLKPVNPNIRSYLGSQKINTKAFSGFMNHKDDIVPYERNYSKKNIEAKGLSSGLDASLNKIHESALVSNAVILKEESDEIKRRGVDHGLTMPEKKEEATTEREREKADDKEDEITKGKSKEKVFKHSHKK